METGYAPFLWQKKNINIFSRYPIWRNFWLFPKNQTHMDKVGQTSELFLAFTDELEKQIST